MRLLLLVVTIATGYALLRGWPGDWHPILRISLAGTAVLISLLLWGRPSKSLLTHAKPARRPHLIDLLSAIGAILLVECLFLAFLAFAPSPSEELALTLEEALEPDFQAITPSAEAISQTSASGSGDLVISNWLFSGPGPRQLNKSKKVRPSNRPEVYLYPATPNDAQALLSNERFLRNFTLSTYRKGSWFPHTIIPRPLKARNKTITRPTTTPGRTITYDIAHQANPRSQTLAITVPNFTTIDQPTLREIAPDTFRLPRSTARKKNYRYKVTSVPFDFKKTTTITPGISPSPEYLALPENPNLRARLQTLATSFGPPSHQSLTALRNHLRTRCEYTLDVSMPENVDPVESFLFDTHLGYCTHFASSTVLLTRAMGIPSRLAFGWSGGRYFQGPNLFVFRAKEAHAWAEIHLKDLGWVIFETTPAAREEGTPTLAPSNEEPPLPDYLDFSETTEPDSPALPLLKASLWTGGLAILALAVLLLLRKKEPANHSNLPANTVLPKSPNYLTAFRQACLAHGIPMPPGRTLRAHLEKISSPAFTSDLLQYHYAVQYGDQPRNKSTEKRLLGQLRNWAKESS